MNKIFKNDYLIPVLSIFLFILINLIFINHSSANVQQLTGTATSTDNNSSVLHFYTGQLSGTFTGLTLKADYTGSYPPYAKYLFENASSTLAYTCYTDNNHYSTSTKLFTIDFTHCLDNSGNYQAAATAAWEGFNFDIGKRYDIVIGRPVGGTINLYGYANNDSGYASSTNSYPYTNPGSAIFSNNGVAYFDFAGDFGSPIYPEIDFKYPYNGLTSPADFTHWELNTTSTAEFFGTEKVAYGQSSSTLEYEDSQGWISSAGISTSTDFLSKGVNLFNSHTLGNWTWYAQAQFLDESNNIVASSSIISFQITGSGIDYTGQSSSTIVATSTPPNATCDNSSEFFGFSFCNLFQHLFIPDTSVLNNFSVLGDTIKKKPPMGYYTAIVTAFNSISTSTSAYSIADLSALDDTLWNPIKNILSILFWLIFSFWIFNRIRHFNFTSP